MTNPDPQEIWQEILAVCGPCSFVMQVGWNGVGEVHCTRCYQPMMTSFIRLIDPPTEDDLADVRLA